MQSSAEILNREFLEVRARLIDLAAALDRIHRGSGSVADHPTLLKVQAAVQILATEEPQRAEKIQQVFSRPYDAEWRQSMEI